LGKTHRQDTSTWGNARGFSTIGYPVVLRVVSPRIIHKAEVQEIALNLADSQAV
jgi:hypothetical protein